MQPGSARSARFCRPCGKLPPGGLQRSCSIACQKDPILHVQSQICPPRRHRCHRRHCAQPGPFRTGRTRQHRPQCPSAGRASPVQRSLRHHQGLLRRARQGQQADHRRHQRHAHRAGSALGLSGRERLQGTAGQHPGRVRRPGHRDRHRGRLHQGGLAHRGYPRVQGRRQGWRPDHQDRRHPHQGHAAGRSRQDDARQAQEPHHPDAAAQGRARAHRAHHRARHHPGAVGAQQAAGTGRGLHPHLAVPGTHRQQPGQPPRTVGQAEQRRAQVRGAGPAQ